MLDGLIVVAFLIGVPTLIEFLERLLWKMAVVRGWIDEEGVAALDAAGVRDAADEALSRETSTSRNRRRSQG